MADYLPLLVLVAAVAAGLVTVVVSSLLVQSRSTPFFRYFLANILLFNLMILVGLVFRFFETETRLQGGEIPPALTAFLLALLALLKLGWLCAFFLTSQALAGDKDSATSKRRLFLPAGVIYLLYAGALVARVAGGPGIVEQVAGIGLELLVIVGAMFAGVVALARIRRLPPGPRRRSLGLFGGFHVTLFAVMLAMLAFAWLGPGRQSSSQMVLGGMLMILYNLVPLVWVLRNPLPAEAGGPGGLERFGITAREREIVELICAGRTNREIAEQLFISEATVKDHNSNIYRKTGVRNRVELANLFMIRPR